MAAVVEFITKTGSVRFMDGWPVAQKVQDERCIISRDIIMLLVSVLEPADRLHHYHRQNNLLSKASMLRCLRQYQYASSPPLPPGERGDERDAREFACLYTPATQMTKGHYLFSLGKIDPRREYSSDGTRENCPSPQRDNFPSDSCVQDKLFSLRLMCTRQAYANANV